MTDNGAVTGREASRWLAVILPFLVLLYLCWLMAQPFLQVLLWAIVLAVVFAPAHRTIAGRFRSPSLAAAISTLLVVLTVLVPLSLITAAVVHEASGIAQGLQTPAALIRPDTPLVGPVISWLSRYIDVERFTSAQFLGERLKAVGAVLAAGAFGIVGGIVSALVQTVLVVFTLFYVFRDGAAIRKAAFNMIPLEGRQISDIAQRTSDVIGATVYGVLLISVIQGSLGTLIFGLLGLPSPLLWGVVMFFLCMIPMAGAFLVWAPAAVYLAATGALVKSGILIGWGVLVIGSIDNFLSPKLVGRRARLHELLIFFSVLGGVQVFGVLGVVLGPVVVALTLAVVEILREANRPAEETLPEKTVLEQQSGLRRAN